MNSAETALITASRRDSFILICPTITELNIVNRIIPFSAGHPAKTAKAPPANPISDKVCVKNDKFRATTKTPIIPQIIAINVLAINA